MKSFIFVYRNQKIKSLNAILINKSKIDPILALL